jgi:hypothetical protein
MRALAESERASRPIPALSLGRCEKNRKKGVTSSIAMTGMSCRQSGAKMGCQSTVQVIQRGGKNRQYFCPAPWAQALEIEKGEWWRTKAP